MAAGLASSIASGAVQSLTGNIETALIVIHDYRSAASSTGATTQEEKQEVLQALSSERVASTKEALSKGTAPSFPNSQDKIFRIHFNPSSLMLNASSASLNEKNLTEDGSINTTIEDPKLYLTTTLYFDDMDTYDSFMAEKFTAGLTVQGVANAAKMVGDITKKRASHSVRPQVEGLISALRNPFTRTISFRWNAFSFIGQLTTIRAKYTMFSTSGKPVRAEVLLRLQHELDPTMLHNWYADFDKAFGRTASKSAKATQMTQNLLNINL